MSRIHWAHLLHFLCLFQTLFRWRLRRCPRRWYRRVRLTLVCWFALTALARTLLGGRLGQAPIPRVIDERYRSKIPGKLELTHSAKERRPIECIVSSHTCSTVPVLDKTRVRLILVCARAAYLAKRCKRGCQHIVSERFGRIFDYDKERALVLVAVAMLLLIFFLGRLKCTSNALPTNKRPLSCFFALSAARVS